jgi:hypothetical protein
MKKVILLGIALTALAGCDKLPFFKVASPPRKPGLWEQTVQSDRSPTPIVTQLCFDAASDLHFPVLPKPRRAGFCQKFAVAKDGASYTVDTACGANGATMTSHTVITGDFTSKYTINSTVDVSNAPDPARNGEHKTTLTAVYKGDCPPDLSPGQVRLPSGEVVEMAQLRGGMMRSGGPGGQGGGAPGGNAAPAPAANAAPAGGGQ